MKRSKKKIIGRREMVAFPDFELYDIEAKIDTGAYTSSVHCKDITHYQKDGSDYVTFILLDDNHPLFADRPLHWPLHSTTMVKNSFGQTEERCVIKTKIQFYGELYDVELSLADRSAMDYPVLLGRKAIRKRFIVDVSKVNCAKRKKIK